MRTKASIRAATSGAIFAAIFAAAAIGGSGPALALCGVSSSSGTGIKPVNTGNGGLHSGVTGSTHGTSPSSCATMTSATKLTGSTLGGGFTGAHFYTHTATGGTHHSFEASSLQTTDSSHTFTAHNKTFQKPKT